MTSLRRSSIVATTLSFLVPGLGQAVSGAVRRGALIAIPTLTLIVAVGAILGAYPDRGYLAGVLLQPEVLLLLIAIDGLLFLYHAGAVIDAYRVSIRRWGLPSGLRRGAALGWLAIVLSVTVALHGAVLYVLAPTYDLMSGFATGGDDGPDWGDEPSSEPGAAGFSGAPTIGPSGSPTVVSTVPATAASSSPTGVPATPAPTVVATWDPKIWATPSSAPTPIVAATSMPTAAPTPVPRASPTPDRSVPYWARDGRLNLLLVGGDAGPDRWSLRTDTMILLSVDIASGRAALFGIPRNLRYVPLPPETARVFPCRCFPGLLNALYVYAMGHPDRFPGGTSRGYRAVSGAVGALVGQPIDGMVVVDLAGFVRLIDTLGGLTITVPKSLYDRNYPLEDGSGHIVLSIRAGRQHMDGRTALAYARSRHQDSDYGRMRRQQLVLLALRRQLKPCALVTRLPTLVSIAKKTVWTNVPVRQLPALLALAERVDVRRVSQYAFTPPTYRQFLRPVDIARIRSVTRNAFGGAPPRPVAPGEAGDGGC